MWEEQESISKLKPRYLFQANFEKNKPPIYFFISYSLEKIWVKQPRHDWEEIKVLDADAIRGGETTYNLSENKYKYTKLFTGDRGVNQPHFKRLPYIEGKTSSGNYLSEDLDEILMSKLKLDELGITKLLDLDLTNMYEETTQDQETAHNKKLSALKEKVRTQYFKKKDDDWFDNLLCEANESKRSRRSQLVNTSIFCAPSTAENSVKSEEEICEKLTAKISQITL